MADLHYLLSSVPTLMFGQMPRYTIEQFFDVASRSLPSAEYDRLIAFRYYNPPVSLDGLGLLERNYWDWEMGLRDELVRLRAEAMGIKPEPYLRLVGSAGLASSLAKEVFVEQNPLKIEQMLDKARYNWLEERRMGRVFHFDIVLIYSMQLQILQRAQSFDKDLGRSRYNEAYQRILGEAESVLTENIS
jgi:hypothetical protein